ncbi:MAG: response regulator [Candidatus Omnitrophota bacterium]|nr:response regulator [Candidatus Omnitrophota bacterium]MBU1894855.1 response regulator [Candidatus Omnitrophota bacterium]
MRSSKKSILIIDDEKGACEFIKSFLEDRGYKVFTALNGLDGLELVKNEKLDLVLLDMKLPKMNGVEILSKIKALNSVVRVFVVTGLEDGDEITQAKKIGVEGVLKKPIQLEELSIIVKGL